MRHQSGFTLLELMIVATIVGIISAISVPIYKDYTYKAYRSEAVQNIQKARIDLREFFRMNNTYVLANTTDYDNFSDTYSTEKYTITLTSDSNSFTLTATPSFTDKECGILSLDQDGIPDIQTQTSGVDLYSTAEKCLS